MRNNAFPLFFSLILTLSIFAPVLRLSSQNAQPPLQNQGEPQAKPKAKSYNALYVDDLAKILLKEDFDELKRIALGARHNADARIHFITGNLKQGTTADDISSQLSRIAGVGVDDGDNDREAIFVITCERNENGFIPHAHLISGKGLEAIIDKSQMCQFINKDLMTALTSKETTNETRSKAILNAYAKTVKFVADDAGKQIDGLDALLDTLTSTVASASPQSNTQNAAQQTVKVVPHNYPDPGIPPTYQGVFPPKPDHKMYVCDWGEMLSSEDRAYMEHLGAKLDALTTAELVIVTVQTLKQESLNDVALKTANNWGIGKKGKDNGCLLFVVRDKMLSKSPGKITIQVGYGLEGRLNDAKCGRILDDIALPPFLKDNCTESEGSSALMQAFEFLATEIAKEYNVSADALGITRDFYPQLPEIKDVNQTIYDFAGIISDHEREFIEGVSSQLKEKAKANIVVVTLEDSHGVSLGSLLAELDSRCKLIGDMNAVVLLFSKDTLSKGKTVFGMRRATSIPKDFITETGISNLRNKIMKPTLESNGDKDASISKAVADNYVCVARKLAKSQKAKLELPEGTADLAKFETGTVTIVVSLIIILVIACVMCPPLLVVIILPFILIYQLFLLPFPSGRQKIKKFWKDVNSNSGSGSSWGGSSSRSRSSYSGRSSSSGRSSYGGGSFGGGGASR